MLALKLLLLFLFVNNSQLLTKNNNSLKLNGELKLITDFNLKIGQNLQCEIINSNLRKRRHTRKIYKNIEIYTPNLQNYFYYPALPDNCFTFKIRAYDEANILLSDEQNDNENSIEIILSNESSIRQYKKMYELKTPNYLNGTKFQHFWIKWSNHGKIEVGFVNGSTFLKFETPNMPSIKYIGIKSKESYDKWILEFDEPKCPDSYSYKIFESNCYEIVKKPKQLISMPPLLINYQKNLLQQFHIDYENYKNSKKNYIFSETYLRRLIQDLDENYKLAKDNHKKILLRDFIIETKEYLNDKTYENIKNIFFEFYENVEKQLNKYYKKEKFLIDYGNKLEKYQYAQKTNDIEQTIVKQDFFYQQPVVNLTKCSSEAIYPFAKSDAICECKTGWAGNGILCGIDTDEDKWPDKKLECSDKYCKTDNCPELSNPNQEDIDNDDIGDVCDFDMDGDDIKNENDNCPKNKNPGQEDSDNDDFGDDCDNCVFIENANQNDTDEDGIGDLCDDDIDNDGILNDKDNCKYIKNFEQMDIDVDDIGDECDNCLNASNKYQSDIDLDGIGDECDDDLDNDSIKNESDNCQKVPNTKQTDSDKDGFGDACDNCPTKFNVEQEDSDKDGIGNLCDNCPEKQNKNQSDADGDGIGDLCDNCAKKNSNQKDDDDDLVGDECDTNKDSDRDGIQDNLDNCVNIANANQIDSNFDGIGNACAESSKDLDKCSSLSTLLSLSPILIVNLDRHIDKSKAKKAEWYDLGSVIYQSFKSDPSLAVGYLSFGGVDYEGVMMVNSTQNNYGEIGLTFSFQSNRKFYLITWHNQESNLGLEIKTIFSSSGPGTYLRNYLILNKDSKQGSSIWRDSNNLGWKIKTEYKWKLIHRPNTGLIQIKIFESDKLIIDSGSLTNNILKGGRLGVYAFNQDSVIWSDFKIQCNES